MVSKKIALANLIVALMLLLVSCNDKNKTDEKKPDDKKTQFLLTLVDPEVTNIDFRNTVVENDDVNIIKFEGLYNGSGVAVGDINNDGLADIYFGGNSSDDQLYLNKGNFEFENVTESAGIKPHASGWSTGINMVDINDDGFLDIYVCRSGPSYDPRDLENKLFINNQDGSFSEQAETYGLNSTMQSRQTAFFDYDLDGDLDMYLMNQPEKDFKGGEFFQYLKKLRSKELQTDYFFENIDGKFVDRTDAAGLVNFGYGHSIAISDLNDDGYPDLHITHDYDDPDFLYYNTGNKTFENRINSQFKHISWSSMGNDFADFNNDGLIDLFTLEMAPDDHVRSKVNMKSMDPQRFNALAANDQQYQYMFNTLQRNNGNDSFSEIAQLAGVSKTDWSWACLFFDIDLDGHKDIFISNGIKRDFLNRDIMTRANSKSKDLGRSVTIYELQDLIPSTISNNIVFKNTADLSFKEATKDWMDKSGFNTNGVAYADLDNDGDLDLVTNNMEDLAGVYENQAVQLNQGNYLKFKFKGAEGNQFAIGTKLVFSRDGQTFVQELYNSRGYLSSMNYELVFGLGSIETIDSVKIIWPDHKVSYLKNVTANATYDLIYDEMDKLDYIPEQTRDPKFNTIDPESLGITFTHKENEHDDYKEQVLLPYSQSMHGPFIDKADVNGDGLTDFYVGGALGQPGELYIQEEKGTFKKQISAAWDNDKSFEDLGVLFFDADNDGDQDLYVVSGGAEFKENHFNYQDRLYINDGKGNFRRALGNLPSFYTSGQVVRTSDIDKDGDQDLFIGGRIVPDKYPMPPPSHILINENGKFRDATSTLLPYVDELGIVTDALFVDYDGDGDEDLITVGEWSAINFHENKDGQFSPAEIGGLEASRGLWFSIDQADIDQDGDIDFIAGNLGLNTKFKADDKKEFHVFSSDFDQSGTYDVVLSNTYNGSLVPVRGRECSSQQMPFIKERFGTYQEFAEADLDDILGSQNLETALHYQLDLLESVFIENLGNGSYKMHPLAREAQMSPIMKTEFIDMDKDGIKEIICFGNMYNVEVETMRYDASIGTIMSYNQGFKVWSPLETGFYANKDAKSSVVIDDYLIITNNNDVFDIFKLN